MRPRSMRSIEPLSLPIKIIPAITGITMDRPVRTATNMPISTTMHIPTGTEKVTVKTMTAPIKRLDIMAIPTHGISTAVVIIDPRVKGFIKLLFLGKIK